MSTNTPFDETRRNAEWSCDRLRKDDTTIDASRAAQDLLITNTGHLHSIHIPVLC
jgi:hypothetical protein